MPSQAIMEFFTVLQLKILGSVWFISSVAGLSALLKSGEILSWRNILSAILYSGIMGLICALFLWNHYIGKIEYLVAISTLAGIGGASVLDFIKAFFLKKAKIQIKVISGEDK